jgi:hypothetical protein
MLSSYPELFKENPDISCIVEDSWKTVKYLEKLQKPTILLSYGKWINDLDRIEAPRSHIIAEIIAKSEIKGNISLRPYWYGNTDKRLLKIDESYVCVQSTKTCSSTPMLNKQWNEEYLQNVINKLSSRFRVVQLGLKNEPKLNNTLDLRGSSISESANYLANATFFLGQVGFLMHLARAVNTRSVIIYGGREKSWQSGYPCNENVETNPECSPCWQNNHCEYDRICLKEITVEDVLEAIERIEKRLPEKLETEVVVLN